MSTDTGTDAFLLRASDEFAGGGWIFTGIHWAVLAARVARRRGYVDLHPVLETGATDGDRADPVTWFRGSSADVLEAIVPKCNRVVKDAVNVDVLGRAIA